MMADPINNTIAAAKLAALQGVGRAPAASDARGVQPEEQQAGPYAFH